MVAHYERGIRIEAVVVALLSYAGQLNLTATADRDACPDLELFAEGVRSGLGDLARSALVSAS